MDDTPNSWLKIALLSFAALGAELIFGFGLAFNPGWANEWPLGLTIYLVFSAGMSCLFFVLLVTFALMLGALAGVAFSRRETDFRRVKAGIIAWILCSCAMAILAGVWAFTKIYDSALREWPKGYHP